MVTDKMRSYGAAKREMVPNLKHRSHKGLNNRPENNHLPFCKRERCTQGFLTPGGLKWYVSCQSAERNCFSDPVRRRSALQIRYLPHGSLRRVQSRCEHRLNGQYNRPLYTQRS